MNARLKILEEKDKEKDAEIRVLKAVTESLQDTVDRLEHNNYVLCGGLRELLRQIKASGATPVFEIDDELCEEMNGSNRR